MTAEKIRALRESLKLTQAAFAAVLGTSQSHVSELESARKRPTATMSRLLSMLEQRPPKKRRR